MTDEYTTLIELLREAGDHDRDRETGAGPLTFCHEAADAIELLLTEVEKYRTLAKDWYDESERGSDRRDLLQARIDNTREYLEGIRQDHASHIILLRDGALKHLSGEWKR